jgi:hypothetical protein
MNAKQAIKRYFRLFIINVTGDIFYILRYPDGQIKENEMEGAWRVQDIHPFKILA